MVLRYIILPAVSTKVQSREERLSLPIQEAEGRRFAEDNGGVVVDVLTVPGHTRRILDFAELRDRSLRKGIDAFVKLEQHWKARDFDVLWVRGGDRFARTQSVHARITEEIINAGARIYAADDGGWVDKHNYRYWIAMSGAKAAGQVDNLVTMTRKVKDNKAAFGLAINSRPIWSHQIVRDEFGKIRSVQPDLSKDLIIRDAVALVLEGVGWGVLERELFTRYGHTNNGKPFTHHFFYHLFHNPYFYGNSARRWRSTQHPNGRKWDLWIFDPAAEPPEGALVHYDTHPPYLDDDLGARLKAELLRRRSAVRGSSRPHRTKRFAGLVFCAECGYALSFVDNGHGTAYYRCTPAAHAYTKRTCTGQFVRGDTIQAYFDAGLREMLRAHNPFHFLKVGQDQPQASADQITTRLAEVRQRARVLIQKQASADVSLSSLYDEQLQTAAAEIKVLEARLIKAERVLNARERAEAERAYVQLQALPDVGELWNKPDVDINRLLHSAMGRYRLMAYRRQIKRVAEPV